MGDQAAVILRWVILLRPLLTVFVTALNMTVACLLQRWWSRPIVQKPTPKEHLPPTDNTPNGRLL